MKINELYIIVESLSGLRLSGLFYMESCVQVKSDKEVQVQV